MKANRLSDKQGFTLIELLVVMVIILILGGLLYPAFTAARETARKTKAKADVRQLDIAFRAVLMDYRTWADSKVPGAPNESGLQVKAGVVNYLNGSDTASNYKKVAYMNFDEKSLVAGDFVDPWKQVFRVALGNTTVSPDGKTLYRQIAAWSLGKKGTSAQYADFIKSWE